MTSRLNNENDTPAKRANPTAKITDLAAFRRKRQQQAEGQAKTNRASRLDKSDSLADYYLGQDEQNARTEGQFENRLSSIKSTLDKLNILMEKISHLEKRQKL